MKDTNSLIYEKRFSDDDTENRNAIWKEIIRCSLQKHIENTDTVLSLASGRCEFINNISCKSKMALDIDKNIRKYAKQNVKVNIGDIMSIDKFIKQKVNVVFMSNILEHLESKNDVLILFSRIRKLLAPKGRVLIVHPNYDLARNRYWDHIDHRIALNGPSVIEALSVAGYKVEKYVKRYLPFTTKSKIPFKERLVKYYLSIPSFLRPFAGQSFFLAVKNEKK